MLNLFIFIVPLFVRVLTNAEPIVDINNVFLEASKLKIGSEKCQEQLRQLFPLKEWGLKMLDATPKLQAGILEGNMIDFGHFDECLKVEHSYTSDDGKDAIILGQYCSFSLFVPLPFLANKKSSLLPQKFQNDMQPRLLFPPPDERNALMNSLCLPDACKPSDFNSILPIFGDGFCQTKETNTEIDSYTIFAIVFFSIFAALLILSTVYDVYIYKTGKKPASLLLVAFSVFSNGKKLFATSKSNNQIQCLHGIRVFSMMWVILGHIGASAQAFIAFNAIETMEIMKESWSQFIQGAHLAVDTFLFLTGFLLTYSFVKSNSRKGSRFNIFMFYFHRYLRLTPPLLATFVFLIGLSKYIIKTPLTPLYDKMFTEPCKEWWWSVFLYVQNYVNMNEICLIQTWYISMDMQIFILSPIVLLPLVKKPKLGLYNLYLITAVSIAIPAAVTYIYKTPMFTQDYYDYYYYLTHTRMAPYLMGMLFGLYVYKTDKKKVTIHWAINLITWAIVLIGMGACVFTGSDIIYNYNRLETTIYLTLLRPAWTLGLIWIVFACMKGYGGVVNWILSLPLFQFWSKLTYSMYLLHQVILTSFGSNKKMIGYVTRSDMVFDFWGYFVYTSVAALICVLAFESPIIILEKVIFAQGKKRNQPNEKVDDQAVQGRNGNDVEAQIDIKVVEELEGERIEEKDRGVNGKGDKVNGRGEKVNGEGRKLNGEGEKANGEEEIVNVEGEKVNGEEKKLNEEGKKVNGEMENVNGGEKKVEEEGEKVEDQTESSH